MDQELHTPQVYDFRQHDRIWQRVAPTLEPYPGLRQSPTPAETLSPVSQMSVAAESQLPGADVNPCCMGSAAAEMLNVITGFIEESLSDRQQFLAGARQAPHWARQTMRDLADSEGSHARRLMAVYYLITGTCYQPALRRERICINSWCVFLRERYHGEACNGLNYARAAEGTTDPCLRRLLDQLSAESYRQADVLLQLLERSLRS